MLQISFRGVSLPSSPIRKLIPYAEEAENKGRKVYYLNIGQPDIQTPALALEAVRNFNGNIIKYSHSAGNETLRRKFAAYYNSKNIDIDFTDLLVTTGASEAFLFAFIACLNPGEELIVPEPFYANYNAMAVATSVNLKPVTSNIEDGFALPSMKKFEELITPQTKGILICNPNNPTGYVYSEKELKQLAKIVKKYNLFLFCDEVYRDFCYTDSPYYSAMQLKDIEEHVVVIDSISKRYSACGVRIGTLISRNKQVINTALKIAQARLSPPGYGQIAAEAALDTPLSYTTNVYNEYIERRNYIIDALNKIEGVYTPLPKGAFYSIVRLPVDDAEKFCQWLLEEFEYENQTLMLAPASGFYSTKLLGKNEVRIAYVLKVEDLMKAVKCLEEALKAYLI